MNSGLVWRRSLLRFIGSSLLLLLGLASLVTGQDFPPTPYTQFSVGTRSGLDLAPSNALAMPGTTAATSSAPTSFSVSSRAFDGILPTIPGFEFAYLHGIGDGEDFGRLLLDYVRPVRFNENTLIFGEAHGIIHDLWGGWSASGYERLDLSVGGGLRKRVPGLGLVGLHGFYDGALLRGVWHSSASIGGNVSTILTGHDGIELAVNWYSGLGADPFSLGRTVDGIKGTLDIKVGYYHRLWNDGPDLQLFLSGYSSNQPLPTVLRDDAGYAAQAVIASPDGRFRATYRLEHDSLVNYIQTVGFAMNVGFRLEKLLSLESPFEAPTPIFSSPRNLEFVETSPSQRPLRKELAIGLGSSKHCDCGGCMDAWTDFYWSHKWGGGSQIDLDKCERLGDCVPDYCPPCSHVRHWLKHSFKNSHKCDKCNMRVSLDCGTGLFKVGFGHWDWFRCPGDSCCFCNPYK